MEKDENLSLFVEKSFINFSISIWSIFNISIIAITVIPHRLSFALITFYIEC